MVAAKREGGKLVGTAGREGRRGAEGAQAPDGAVEPGDVAGGIKAFKKGMKEDEGEKSDTAAASQAPQVTGQTTTTTEASDKSKV
jgi:hypothetical protein